MGGGLCLRQQVWQLARHGQISHTPAVARPRSGGRRGGAGAVRVHRGTPTVATEKFRIDIRFGPQRTHFSWSRAYIGSLNSDTRTSHRTHPRVTLWGSGNYLGGKLMASGTIVLVANSWHRELGGKLGDAIAQRAHLR